MRRARARAPAIVCALATLGCLCGAPPEQPSAAEIPPDNPRPERPERTGPPHARHVPLPPGELAVAEHMPAIPRIEFAELVAPPVAVETECVPDIHVPPSTLVSANAEPAGRRAGPCRSTTYYDGVARDHHVHEYDDRGRDVVSYSYYNGDHYYTRLAEYGADGEPIGWRVVAAEADDMIGTFRCERAPDERRVRVLRAAAGMEPEVYVTVSYDDAGRPIEVEWAITGRTEGFGWGPGGELPGIDSPHRYAYDPTSRTILERWDDLGHWEIWTVYREDGQPESRVTIRNREPNEWAVYRYDAHGNLLEIQRRSPDGSVRRTVLAYDCWDE